jgi:alanine racemase
MSKLPQTYLEIDLSALRHNFFTIKDHIKPSTKIMAVVKSNAYGSDVNRVSKCLEQLGVDSFAVAYTEEGVALRKSGIDLPVLVFYPQKSELEQLISHNLMPSVYSIELLQYISDHVHDKNLDTFDFHLNINTGMNRLGFDLQDYESARTMIQKTTKLNLSGIFSHFSSPGTDEDVEFTEQQIKNFKNAVSFFKPLGTSDFLTHLSNSSGLINYREAGMDMIRIGITLYGYGKKSTETKLIPISTLKSEIIQMRWVNKGESVGYNRMFKAKRKTLVATIPLGYVDGISRLYGNYNGKVLINGQYAPIIGNVCMDTLMLDVTDIECKKGDKVLIFGKTHPITAFDCNGLSIPYELMCRIPKRIQRVFVNE